MSALRFKAIGGGNEIGANSYLLEMDAHRVLLDCGIHPKKEGLESLPDFSLLDAPPDAVLISHAHIDHCGAVPYLLRECPGVMPFATMPTAGIMDRMLHNSVSVMGILAKQRNIAEYPLYSHGEVEYAIRRMKSKDMGMPFSVTADGTWKARFYHAGHVLGSACVQVDLPGHRVLYTGDICLEDQELLGGLESSDLSTPIDTLIIESTYGANDSADKVSFDTEVDRFCEAIAEVLHNGGVALIPSFALGRTQEMLNIISRLQEDGRLPQVPVYSSGLGRAVYEQYDRFSHYLKPESTLRPLNAYRRVGDVWNRNVTKVLLRDPAIVVATSGMMIENTPSSMIAELMVQDDRHGIFFVGYLDPDTLGYHLLNSKPGDRLTFEEGAEPVEVKLDNIQRFYFSAHAPRHALKDLIEQVAPKNVVFVHGDPEAIDWMAEHTANGCRRFTACPGETITLEA